jgi:tripartite ATP-independent transporter DctP family solute receptor
MKRLTALLLALFMLASVSQLFAGGGGQQGGGQRQRVYRLADNQPHDYPTNVGNRAWAKYVEDHTNGAIKIEVYDTATLGDERTTIEQTQTGAIHFLRVGLSNLAVVNPIINVLNMPFLYRDREHMFKVVDGPIGQEFLDSLTRQNLLGLAWYDAGFRSFYNSQREIRTPADMVGLRIRVQETPIMMDMVRLLGAQPTPMAVSEVYSGIQNGVVHGAENNWPSYIHQAHFEVAKFFTVNNHMAAPEMIIVNTGVWNSFSDAEKKIVRDGAMEAARVQRAEWLRQERELEARARASGNTITDLTPAQHQLFTNALMPMYDQPAYAQYADIVRRIRETR